MPESRSLVVRTLVDYRLNTLGKLIDTRSLRMRVRGGHRRPVDSTNLVCSRWIRVPGFGRRGFLDGQDRWSQHKQTNTDPKDRINPTMDIVENTTFNDMTLSEM